uniref:RING-type domain-containing protein n=1 Tax=Clastoptera arizonana TaxID=38151 RepID=A0A1B6C2A5_9HEMI
MNRSNQSFSENISEEISMASRSNHGEGPGRRLIEGARNPLSRLTQLERHTFEGSRLIRDNFYNVIEELCPLVQSHTDQNSRLTLQSWLHNRPSSLNNPPPNNESFVIDLEGNFNQTGDNNTDSNNIQVIDSPTSQGVLDLSNSSGEGNNNSLGSDEGSNETFQQNAEINPAIIFLKKYFPFALILIGKLILDHIPSILLFLGLYGTFGFYNSRLKSEIALHMQRSSIFLIFANFHIFITIFCFYLLYDDMKLYLILVFIPPYSDNYPKTVTDLLWIVAVSDFILKLITIFVKICLTLIPHKVFEAKYRGKWYLAVETTSQLYRCLVPIQPWLYYLLESYQGPQKVIGVFLSAAYMVAKGADLMGRTKTWWASVLKLLQNVQLGVSPDKDQLTLAGLNCPICHDDFDQPVKLTCDHVFCEECVARWFDREQTCPLCRAKVVDDPTWRDGGTTQFVQLY